MVIELSTLIYNVRNELSSIPDDLITSEQIHDELIKSNLYISYIIDSEFDDENIIKQALISLAAYYSYVNYTALVSLRMDDVPQYVYQREKILKAIALQFLKLITKYPLDSNLMIDEKLLGKIGAIGYTNTNSIWS